jgi:hypothetical protein
MVRQQRVYPKDGFHAILELCSLDVVVEIRGEDDLYVLGARRQDHVGPQRAHVGYWSYFRHNIPQSVACVGFSKPRKGSEKKISNPDSHLSRSSAFQ